MKPEKKRHGCLAIVLSILLIALICIAGVFMWTKYMPTRIQQRVQQSAPPQESTPTKAPVSQDVGDKKEEDDNIQPTSTPKPTPEPVDWSVNTSLPDDEWLNILLLGSDASDPDQPGRTDVMMVASVNMNNGQLKLTSIMRDTYVPIAGHGHNKINAANWFGGVDLALKTVNEAFDMNITHYAIVDFSSFAYIVEELGGVDLAVTEKEMLYVNKLMADMRVLYPNITLQKNDLTESGDSVHLDGMQTLAFSRIRKLDSDYQRTGRQRQVIEAILAKMRSVRNPDTLYQLFDIGMKYTRTSLSASEITLLAMKVITNGLDYEELRLPADGAYKSASYNGQSVLDPDLSKNTEILHEFIYGKGNE